MNKQTTNT